jgi:hypothetical protein
MQPLVVRASIGGYTCPQIGGARRVILVIIGPTLLACATSARIPPALE